MARYRAAKVGVLDQSNGNLLILRGGAAWDEYEAWLRAGNVPDALVADPGPDLPERKLRRKNATQRYMRATASTGVDAAGTHFQFDDYDLGVLHGAALMVLAGDALPAAFKWRDVNGVLTDITAAQVKTIVKQLATRQYAILRKRWDIEASIDASSNPESINPDDYAGL